MTAFPWYTTQQHHTSLHTSNSQNRSATLTNNNNNNPSRTIDNLEIVGSYCSVGRTGVSWMKTSCPSGMKQPILNPIILTVAIARSVLAVTHTISHLVCENDPISCFYLRQLKEKKQELKTADLALGKTTSRLSQGSHCTCVWVCVCVCAQSVYTCACLHTKPVIHHTCSTNRILTWRFLREHVRGKGRWGELDWSGKLLLLY